MKFSILVTVTMALSIMAITTGSQSSEAYVIPSTSSDPERVPLVKRSLCNTFGGCGAKRSMQQLTLNNGQTTGQQHYDSFSDGNDEPWSTTIDKRESKLISEILNDLIEYLKTSEKYKQGKYVVMVSKPADSSSSRASQSGNNLQFNTLDVQELQSGRYINKDE